MDATVLAVAEPQGFCVKFVDGSFQTLRYILTDDLNGTPRFTLVNPFGDARFFTIHATFDFAMANAFADVENQFANRNTK